ncbi:hypothetical protein HPB50_020702 [Hyalomma asiaticum]|uniref:Uncharacterized protein n=1 Tax=Hyalomma asiaticum TaxID=266040 RepID=A0ACB7S587_HYAAI|nr:hypothetical protein HPB50_020702 [Hyalomma asiaticum]
MGAIGHRIAHCSIEPRAAGDEAKPATLALVNDRPPSVCASSTDAATSDPELPHASGEAELDDDYLSPPCAAEERRVSVSPAPCVGDDTPRCDVADGNMSRGSTDQPPDTGLYHEPANTEPGAEVVHESASVSPVVDVDREVTGCSSGAQMNHDAASHVDQGVQCAPTSAEIGVQCSKDPSRIADMMRREHLIRMEILRSHKEALMKKLGLPPP